MLDRLCFSMHNNMHMCKLSNSLHPSRTAIGTRPVVVLVNQTGDEIRGYTDDQSISNDRKHTNGLQHIRPNT